MDALVSPFALALYGVTVAFVVVVVWLLRPVPRRRDGAR